MPNIIKHYGKAMEFVDADGKRVEREESIFLKSHNAWYRTAPYDNHFVYRSNRLGAATLCTCGATAVVVNYEVYQKYSSTNYGPLLVCSMHMQTGRHADGSS